MSNRSVVEALHRQIAARRAEAAACDRGAQACFERAEAIRAVVDALDEESTGTGDTAQRARLENESRVSVREAELADGEGRRLLAERDRALGQARTAEVKSEAITHGRR